MCFLVLVQSCAIVFGQHQMESRKSQVQAVVVEVEAVVLFAGAALRVWRPGPTPYDGLLLPSLLPAHQDHQISARSHTLLSGSDWISLKTFGFFLNGLSGLAGFSGMPQQAIWLHLGSPSGISGGISVGDSLAMPSRRESMQALNFLRICRQ